MTSNGKDAKHCFQIQRIAEMLSCYKRPKARPDNSGAPVRNVDQNVMTEPVIRTSTSD
jgi:hypothetical protein